MEPSSTDEVAPLSDVLRALSEEARTCWVRVTDGEREGRLRFEDGELVEIQFGQLRGASAMFALMKAHGIRHQMVDASSATHADDDEAGTVERAQVAQTGENPEAASPEGALDLEEAASAASEAALWGVGLDAEPQGAPEPGAEAETTDEANSKGLAVAEAAETAEGAAETPDSEAGADLRSEAKAPAEPVVEGAAEPEATPDEPREEVPELQGSVAAASQLAAAPPQAEAEGPEASLRDSAEGLPCTPEGEADGVPETSAPPAVVARRSDWPRTAPSQSQSNLIPIAALVGVAAAALLAVVSWKSSRDPAAATHPEPGATAGALARVGEPPSRTGSGAAQEVETAAETAGGRRVEQLPQWIDGRAPEAPQGVLVPTIVLRVLVGADGQVRRAEVESPRPALAALEQRALEMVRSHRFRPAMRAGTPIEAWTTLPLTFEPAAFERTLVIQGSDVLASALGSAWALAAERARPGLRIRREGFGSKGGLAGLLRGRAELALSTRPLDATELALAEQLGASLRELLAGYDGVAVITHPDNPVRELDLATLARIYTREVTHWSEVAGVDAPIHVLEKPSYAAAHALFTERVLAGVSADARLGEEVEVVESSQEIVSRVAGDVHAIGYVSLGHVQSTVRALGLRRHAEAPAVSPSAATLRDGSYPLVRPLLLYLRANAGADARALVEVAFSKAGQAALVEHGLAPRPSAEKLSLEPAYSATFETRLLPHPIYFQPGGALLAKGAWSQLRAIGAALGSTERVLVVGNTDSTGTAEVNTRIAERRAQLVAAVLRQYSGETPIETDSAGSDYPLATNTTPEGRDANRRVDVFVLPR